MNRRPMHAAQPEKTDTCLIFELCDLIEATSELDGKPHDRQRAVQQVISAAHRVVEAARPVMDAEAALIIALREAAAARPPIPESCPGCKKMNGGQCGRHAVSTAVAETYRDLGHALSGQGFATWIAPADRDGAPG